MNRAETALSDSTVSRLAQRWSVSLPGGGAWAAATSGDRVYVGGDDLRAHDLATGAPAWRSALPAGYVVRHAPALDPTAGTIFFVASPSNGLSVLFALRLSDGGLKYKRTLPGASQGAPTIANGLVYVPDNNFGTLHVSAYALGGALRWRIALPAVGGDPSGAAVTVAGGRLFMQLGNDVKAYDAKTGAALWSTAYAAGGGTTGSAAYPVVSGSTLYYASGGQVRALDVAAGTARWSVAVPNAYTVTVDGIAGEVFTTSFPDGGGATSLVALDSIDGLPHWNRPVAGVTGPVTVANGLIYAGQATGTGQGLGVLSEYSGLPVRPSITLPGGYSPQWPIVSAGRAVTTTWGYLPALTVLGLPG